MTIQESGQSPEPYKDTVTEFSDKLATVTTTVLEKSIKVPEAVSYQSLSSICWVRNSEGKTAAFPCVLVMTDVFHNVTQVDRLVMISTRTGGTVLRFDSDSFIDLLHDRQWYLGDDVISSAKEFDIPNDSAAYIHIGYIFEGDSVAPNLEIPLNPLTNADSLDRYKANIAYSLMRQTENNPSSRLLFDGALDHFQLPQE